MWVTALFPMMYDLHMLVTYTYMHKVNEFSYFLPLPHHYQDMGYFDLCCFFLIIWIKRNCAVSFWYEVIQEEPNFSFPFDQSSLSFAHMQPKFWVFICHYKFLSMTSENSYFWYILWAQLHLLLYILWFNLTHFFSVLCIFSQNVSPSQNKPTVF